MILLMASHLVETNPGQTPPSFKTLLGSRAVSASVAAVILSLERREFFVVASWRTRFVR